MERDMELVRKILLELEKHDDPVRPPCNFEIEGYTAAQTSYHIQIMTQANLVEAEYQKHPYFLWQPSNLTWEGHEFLDASRDENFWNKAKGKLSAVTGGLSLELLKFVLHSLAKQQLEFGG